MITIYRNTLIFAERDDVTIGEAGWEPGKGRIKRGADGDNSDVPEKRRESQAAPLSFFTPAPSAI